MANKRFRNLTGASSLSGSDIFAIENGAGNSRKITAARVRNYMDDTVAASLTAHEADTTTHGISTFVATLLGASNLAALMALLDIELTGTGASGSLNIGGVMTLTWRDHTLAANTTATKAYGNDHTYTTWAKAWISGDDFLGAANEISVGVSSHGTTTATVKNDGDGTSTFVLFSIGV